MWPGEVRAIELGLFPENSPACTPWPEARDLEEAGNLRQSRASAQGGLGEAGWLGSPRHVRRGIQAGGPRVVHAPLWLEEERVTFPCHPEGCKHAQTASRPQGAWCMKHMQEKL